MAKYILKRLFLALITIIVALTITYFLLRMINKVPTALEAKVQAALTANKGRDPEGTTKAIYDAAGYYPDMNAFEAFGQYVSGVFHGDFGAYFTDQNKSIQTLFAEPLKYTFLVAGIGFIYGTILGILFGIFAGYKRGKLPDVALNIFSILFVAVPSFVLAVILIITANKTGWPVKFSSVIESGSLGATLKTLVLPIAIITLTSFATITYYIRNEVVEVLKSDHVATARSKGLSEYNIFMSHVARNISIPAVTIILPRFVFIIMGSLIIELFFGVPGTASMFSQGVTKYEYNVIMFSILFFSSLSLLVSILIDVLYTILDPRIKLADKSDFSFIQRMKRSRLRRVNAKGGQDE